VSSPISSEALGSHQIVKLADNRWAVLVGNGVDSNDQSSGLAASGPGRPVLYAFYVDDAEPRWRRFAVDELLGVNGDAALSTRNGLSTPRPVDVDGDGRVDIAYAGDIRGNLWRFDLKSLAAPAVSRLYAAGAERPIHGAPLVVRNGRSGACPVSQGNRCWQVIVGTGAYLSPLRGTSNAAVQRIVSILDLGDGSTTEDSALVTLPYESLTGAAGVEFRFSAGSDLDYTSGKRGWRIALARREHTVSAPLLLPNAQLRLSTVRPTGGPSAGGQCQPARSWVFQADPAAGPPSADSVDFNNDGMIDAQDRMATGGSDIKRPPLAMAVSGAQFATPGLLLARKVAANSAYLVFPSLNIDTGTNTGGAAGTNVPAVGRAPSPAAGGLARVGDRKTLGRVSWRKAQ
jgi:type IV pilus assembly protein PilY1